MLYRFLKKILTSIWFLQLLQKRNSKHLKDIRLKPALEKLKIYWASKKLISFASKKRLLKMFFFFKTKRSSKSLFNIFKVSHKPINHPLKYLWPESKLHDRIRRPKFDNNHRFLPLLLNNLPLQKCMDKREFFTK